MERENQMERERLGSRLGFILLSAGCAIGCGNVWKFPWMCGQYGGGGFVLIYVLCLLLLGLPVMTMEFAVGRAAQASPLHMYQKLERKGQKWHIHGYVAFFGNIALMAFYTVVTGWIVYYFVKFLTGQTENLGFVAMITNPGVNVTYLAVTVIVAFTILCFNLQGGLERISKYMMTLLLVLMGVVNLFVVRTGTPVVALGPLSITDQGVTIAVLYACRFALVIILGAVFLTTTTPTAMTDAFATLISPLNRLGIHAQEIALVMSLALRFIPTLTDETRAIVDAQSARGGSIETGSLAQRIKAMSAIIVPIFAGTLRHADNLSLALDARCYEEDIRRTLAVADQAEKLQSSKDM